MKIYGSPFRYFQGVGIIEHISDILAPLGDNFLLVADRMVVDPIGNQISDSLHQSHMHCILIPFGGECCNSEISRIIKKAHSLIFGFVNFGFEPTLEIEARGTPDLSDLGIGVLSGMTAAYATGRSNVMTTLAGVAIAAARVPPSPL